MEGTVSSGNKIVGKLYSKGSAMGGVGTVFGKDGKSAYEVAVKNGFEGTEEEWLASLKGEQGERGEQGEKGDKGDAGVVKFIVYPTLPTENIDESAIYLIPSTTTGEQDIFEEYIYIDGIWEKIGGASVEINLDDYVKKTDYASASVGGVVKVQPDAYGLFINSNGLLSVMKPTTQQIDAKIDDYKPIVPSVLDYAVKVGLTTNTLTLTDDEKTAVQTWFGVTDYVKNTDYATQTKAGVVKINDKYGVRILSGVLDVCAANKSHIDDRQMKENPLYERTPNTRYPIVPANLDYAVKTALVSNTITLTDEEKTAIKNWLGIPSAEEVSY